MQYINKEQQIENLLKDIKRGINSKNVDLGIAILKWTIEKIRLDTLEKERQKLNKINKSKNRPRKVNRGEVYGAILGSNVGSEQNGKSRPVMVIQEMNNNHSSPTVIVAPLTGAIDKNGNPKKLLSTHILIEHENLSKQSILKLEHCRSISKNRLTELMCNIDVISINLDEKIKLVYGIKNT